jgi:transposase
MGRPGLPPGIYFRLPLIGYFEGIDSERGIAWRGFVTHRAVFTWVLQCLGTAGLVKGKTIGIDATTLEADGRSSVSVRRAASSAVW